jgi:hypothetical protein
MRPLRILITNIFLTSRSGTEVVVRELALGLHAAGHVPMVYSPELGDIAREIAAAGIPVTDDLDRVPHQPDVVHGHHHVETVQALQHFPEACGIFVCHDRLAWHDTPPLFPRVLRYVAVDLNCRERLAESGLISDSKMRVIHNWVCTDRFPQRSPLPPSPKRALIFSNYAGMGTHQEPIEEACSALNIPVDVIGSGAGTAVERPEELLGSYDLVFAKARCALEAMATGAAVVLCDTSGLGPLVTTDAVEALREWNFGRRCLSRPLDPSLIKREIGRYDPRNARAVSSYIRENASFDSALDRYLCLYEEVLVEHRARPPEARHEVRDYLRATVQRLGELEREVDGIRPRQRMPVLPWWAPARVRIGILEAPSPVGCGAAFSMTVELENQTAWTLGSFPPFPVNFSYRWMSRLARRRLAREGDRTPLLRALDPAQKGTYRMKVTAPDRPGKYRLRATLVQEGIRWLDDRFPKVFADTTITVA